MNNIFKKHSNLTKIGAILIVLATLMCAIFLAGISATSDRKGSVANASDNILSATTSSDATFGHFLNISNLWAFTIEPTNPTFGQFHFYIQTSSNNFSTPIVDIEYDRLQDDFFANVFTFNYVSLGLTPTQYSQIVHYGLTSISVMVETQAGIIYLWGNTNPNLEYFDFTFVLRFPANTHFNYTLVAYSQIVNLPPNPTKLGHTFVGWYLDSAFTIPHTGQPIFEDTELFARFEINTHTVNFVTGTTQNVATQVVNFNTTATLPTVPVRTGFTFEGWYTTLMNNGGAPFNFDTPITTDITLYARWEPIILTVTFFVGGNILTTIDVVWGTTLVNAISGADALQAENKIINAFFSDVYHTTPISLATTLTSDTVLHVDVTTIYPTVFQQIASFFSDNWLWFAIGGGVLKLLVVLGLIASKKTV